MWCDLYTGTLTSVLVPPSLFALIGAEQARSGFGGIGEFRTAALAARLAWGYISSHAVSPAEGFDGADRDAQGFRYSGISSFLLTHSYDLFLL